MRRLGMVVGGLVWFVLVFYITFRWTFPSDAVADRIRVEVNEATGGQNELMLSNVRPWWTGLTADNVTLISVGQARGSTPADKTVLATFDAARVKASLFSLLRQAPRVTGAVEVGGTPVDFDITLAMNKRGTELTPRMVKISASNLAVVDLAALGNVTLDATGSVDLELEIDSQETMRDAVGHIKMSGTNVVIASIDPEITGGMDLGREIPLDEIDLHLIIESGKAEIRRGTIRSPLADIELEGDISLRDDLMRSSMSILIKFDIGEELEMFKPFLKDAEQTNGEYHYRMSGLLSGPSFRAERQRTSSSRPRTIERKAGLSAEDRDRRKVELEKLRENAEKRRAERDANREDPEELEEAGYVEDEDEDEDGEEGQEDESLDEEDLGLDEDVEFED